MDADDMTTGLSRRIGRTYIPCDPVPGSHEECMNGGVCMDDSDDVMKLREASFATCKCIDNWMGARCDVRIGFALMNLGPLNDAEVYRANIAALLSVAVLFVVVGCIASFVYIRYRRKKRVMADHAFEATAEDLYRRPFNNRSSIVESLSRLNSVRRSGNGRDSPPPPLVSTAPTDHGTKQGCGEDLETDAIVIHTSNSSEVLKTSADVRNLLTVPECN